MHFAPSALLLLLATSINAAALPGDAASTEENPRVPQTQSKAVSLQSDVAGQACDGVGALITPAVARSIGVAALTTKAEVVVPLDIPIATRDGAICSRLVHRRRNAGEG
ncbi:hypothetical protein FN846DRAFT_914681 [Sphaerosporella brunnea]|uniref:Hydrophobin n=1 Tax=Sphaerosporella brunnea TaxID=1250544 RepID=A0A5J5EBG6_9PEZI|nr:hypothetical protein FN846DRAFT_914681 [Sphaerosporella brunnea]